MTTTNKQKDPARRTSRVSDLDKCALKPDSLVGSYFHTFTRGEDNKKRFQYQGCVVAEPHPGVYLVETFDWIVGAASCQYLKRIEDMSEWHFYDDDKWMNNYYHDHDHDR